MGPGKFSVQKPSAGFKGNSARASLPLPPQNVRKIFAHTDFIEAWAYERNALYFVHPYNTRLVRALTVALLH